MDDDDSIVAISSYISQHWRGVLPEGEIVSVAPVVVWMQVPLSGVRVSKCEANATNLCRSSRQSLNLRQSTVYENGFICAVVVCNLALDGGIWRDQIGKVSCSTTPSNGQCSLITAAVRTTIGSLEVRSSILAEHRSELLVAAQWQSAIDVFQQDCGSTANRSDQSAVLLTNIDVFVDKTIPILWSDIAVDGSVGVERPGVEIGRFVVLLAVAIDKVPGANKLMSAKVRTCLVYGLQCWNEHQRPPPQGRTYHAARMRVAMSSRRH